MASYNIKSNKYTQPGIGNASSYQVSGIPFLSGGMNCATATDNIIEVRFPNVTNWISVVNRDTTTTKYVQVSFSRLGLSTNNYIELSDSNYNYGQSELLYVKVERIFLKGDSTAVDVVAGLTGIPTGSIVDNWSGSNGVG
jgi:hypothetical protein